MMRKTIKAALAVGLIIPIASQAVVIDFAGGTAYFNGGGSIGTDNSSTYSDVDYYEEGGFKLDFIGGVGVPFTAHIGDYYGAGNAVIHGHWETGFYGTLSQIVVTKIGGGSFDLNYFILTSNTDTGGSAASGLEMAYISHDGGADPILLPPENWGFPANQIFLPASYDGITSFEFYVANHVDCFGMDEFYIDEPPPVPPPGVPDAGATAGMLAIALGGLGLLRRSVRR